jgi:hypothetical protein
MRYKTAFVFRRKLVLCAVCSVILSPVLTTPAPARGKEVLPPPSCVTVASSPDHLSASDVSVPTTPAMLLQNIKLAAQSHWFERSDLYDDTFIRALLGVNEIKRMILSTPGAKSAQMPPSEIEDFRGEGKFELIAPDGSSHVFEYNFILSRALTGELTNHLFRQLLLYIGSYSAPGRVTLSHNDVGAVFGRGVPPPPTDWNYHPTDGGVPPGEEVFYSCSIDGWTETLTAQLDGERVDRLELAIQKK